MAAFGPRGVDDLVQGDGLGVEFDGNPEFLPGGGMYSLHRRFFETDDTAGNVLPRARMIVVSPRQQRPLLIILNQEVHIDHRSDPADKEKNLFRQSMMGIRN